MSMLTKLVDGLRGRAKAFRQGNLLFGADDAAMMEEAADAIEHVRGRYTELMARNKETYDAGFRSGMHAALHQLDGMLAENAGIADIEKWIEEQWEES